MGLIKCPDCERRISDRADVCPFCGCPSKYFSESTVTETVSSISKTSKIKTPVSKQEIISSQDDNSISFVFGQTKVSYSVSIKKFAQFYGQYSSLARKYARKYLNEYGSAGDIYSVLTNLTDRVQSDLRVTVEQAVKDLYSCGIIITCDDFINEYDIDFQDEITLLYEQYHAVQQEKDDLTYQRNLKKASRGRWQGGGFGMRGAIKGAVKASILNAGSDLLHSVGDGFAERSDNKYINNKLDNIYQSDENMLEFGAAVYDSFLGIRNGIKEEMAEKGIIDANCLDDSGAIASLYETTIKCEKDHNKMFENMVNCFKNEPETIKYYQPIIEDLFERECELENFLHFWNLDYIYKGLKDKYDNKLVEETNNPFIINRCSLVIQISGILKEMNNGILIQSKILKGTPKIGDTVVFVRGIATPVLSADILRIYEGEDTVKLTKIGRNYNLLLNLKNTDAFTDAFLLVDSESFDQPESNLYVQYESEGEKILWGFAEQTDEGGTYIFTFVKEDKYISCRGITFDDTFDSVKKIYGDIPESLCLLQKDIVYENGKDNDWDDVDVLVNAKKLLVYGFGESYNMRFYFDDVGQLILVAYLKNIGISDDEQGTVFLGEASSIEWQVKCSKCGHSISRNIKFCNFCGEPNPLFTIECPSCGRKIKKGIKFCNFCGQDFINIYLKKTDAY